MVRGELVDDMAFDRKTEFGFAPIIFLILFLMVTLGISGKLLNDRLKKEVVSSPLPTVVTSSEPTTKPKTSILPTKTPSATSTSITSTATPTAKPYITSSSTPTPTPTFVSSTPTLRVTSPNGGEIFTEGEMTTISWDATGIFSSFTIMYTDCPSCASNITTVSGTSRSYSWNVNVGNTTNTQFKIKIVSYPTTYSGPNPVDSSDSDFTVYQSN